MKPTVTFVVPCYRLAHLLPECVNSILSQTYGDFELLIMDDCSPDDTPSVAASWRDARVKHVRNETNLGHLRNYNRGIALARGEYIWLISADDWLRTPHILERYVRAMKKNPRVGYTCCPGVKLEEGKAPEIENQVARDDTLLAGRRFLRRLLKHGNCVTAASGMVRRDCYERLGVFPEDMPYAGDWFLWCLFALHYDVAFFAEPMVTYRRHGLSFTNYLSDERFSVRFKDGLAVLWTIKRAAERIGCRDIVEQCRRSLAGEYALNIVGRRTGGSSYRMSSEEFEASLHEHAAGAAEENSIKARVWQRTGDCYFQQRDLAQAKKCYTAALRYKPRMLKARVKRSLLGSGDFGVAFRQGAFAFKQILSDLRSRI